MEIDMKENLKMINSMEKEYIIINQAKNMKVI